MIETEGVDVFLIARPLVDYQHFTRWLAYSNKKNTIY
jgi:hypothetical protein